MEETQIYFFVSILSHFYLEESQKSVREDLKPVRPLPKGADSSPQPSGTKGKGDSKKRSAGKCPENAAQKAGMKGPVSSKQTRKNTKHRTRTQKGRITFRIYI